MWVHVQKTLHEYARFLQANKFPDTVEEHAPEPKVIAVVEGKGNFFRQCCCSTFCVVNRSPYSDTVINVTDIQR